MEFIKFILIIVLCYYLIRIILKLFFPLVLLWITKRAMGKFFHGNFTGNWNNTNESLDNDIRIDSKNNKSKANEDVSEYVDYEEIKN